MMQAEQRLFPDLPDVSSVVEEPSDEDYARAARYALRLHRLPRAIEQISAALALAPDSQLHLTLLDEIFAASRAPLQLVRVSGADSFFGLLAVRAEALARSGAASEAFALLTEVVAFSPHTPYVPWAHRWLRDRRFAARVSPEDVAGLLLALAPLAPLATAANTASDGLNGNLSAALVLAAELAEQKPKSPHLAAARSRLLRALERYGEACAILREQGDTPEIAIERAMNHRALGELDECRRCYEQALAARPEDPKTWIALADIWLELADLEAAEAAYGRALALESSALTRGKRAYLRALLGAESEAALELERLAHGEKALRPFASDLHAYERGLIDPHDAIAGVIRDVLQRSLAFPPGQRLNARVRASRPLAPSAWLAFQLGRERLGRMGSLIVEHDAGQPTASALWLRNESGFRCALSKPPAGVLDAVQRIAGLPFAWAHWAHEARAAAMTHAGCCQELVAATAWVGDPPDDIHPVEWVHRWQIAVALLLAAARMQWETRREALMLLLAERDWSSAAAVLGLVASAELDAGLREPVLEILTALASEPDAAQRAHARTLAISGMRIGNASEREPFARLRVTALLASIPRDD